MGVELIAVKTRIIFIHYMNTLECKADPVECSPNSHSESPTFEHNMHLSQKLVTLCFVLWFFHNFIQEVPFSNKVHAFEADACLLFNFGMICKVQRSGTNMSTYNAKKICNYVLHGGRKRIAMSQIVIRSISKGKTPIYWRGMSLSPDTITWSFLCMDWKCLGPLYVILSGCIDSMKKGLFSHKDYFT
jgi:hypothetical protein